MVLITALAVLGGLGSLALTYLFISQLAVVVSWLTVLAAASVAVYSTYILVTENLLGFLGFEEDSLWNVLSSISIGGTLGAISFRLFEAAVTALGYGIGLVVILAAVLAYFGLLTSVVSTGVGVVQVLIDIFGGEN